MPKLLSVFGLALMLALAPAAAHAAHQGYIKTEGTTVTRPYGNKASLSSDLLADFTFARASSATRVNESGVIETVLADFPRIDYTDGEGVVLLEPASTNLYLNSAILVTQNVTTTATPYTVSFYGTGTVTFSGTHTGSLVGTGANDRVSLTFTPTAGTLTSTVSGTVEEAQIENLSYATSRIRTLGTTVTRLEDVVSVTPPIEATKAIITIDNVDTEIFDFLPIYTLPNGNINKFLMNVGGTTYDILTDFNRRITKMSS